MKKIISLFLILWLFGKSTAQNIDSLKTIEYVELNKAFNNPDLVFKLNLSNQKLNKEDINKLSLFKNLEVLDLSNDHLKDIPNSIFELKNLKVLNLNGNDIEIIPNEFKNLLNVEELFLENEKKLNFTKAILALERLPKLKKLHLDGNALKVSPVGLNNLVALQELYLGKNPINLKLNDINHLGNLKSLHLTNNGITSSQSIKEMETFGIKVKLSD